MLVRDYVRTMTQEQIDVITLRVWRRFNTYPRLVFEHCEDAVSRAIERGFLRDTDVAYDPAMWVYVVACNSIRDLLKVPREQMTIGAARIEDVMDEQREALFAPIDELCRAERTERASLLRAALRTLTDKQRRAFWLRIRWNRSPDEIAAVIGSSPSSVVNLVARARHNLRKALQQLDPTLT